MDVVADVIAAVVVVAMIPARVRSSDGVSPSDAVCRRRPCRRMRCAVGVRAVGCGVPSASLPSDVMRRRDASATPRAAGCFLFDETDKFI